MITKAFNTWKSWIIAVACCIVYCLLVLVHRLSALFYVELMELYNIDRKTASIPFVIIAFVRCFTGIIFGILGERFGLQRIMYLGCYLSVLGVGLSYFAHNIITLSVTLGLIYGFGFTCATLLPNIIREHFDDSAITISNGLISVGPCLTAIIFPGLLIYLIEEYGVFGSLLLSSGIILNAIPFIVILKPRNKLSKIQKTASDIEREPQKEASNLKDFDASLRNEEDITDSNIVREGEENGQTDLCRDEIGIYKVTASFIKKKVPRCSSHNEEGCPCITISAREQKYNLQNIYENKATLKVSDSPENNVDNCSKLCANSQEVEISYQQEDSMDERNRKKKKSIFYTLNVFKDPTFITLSLVQGLFAYTFHIWLTTMIDYSRDKGIDRSYEIYILTLNPITDIAGRLGLAWITDKGFLSIPKYCALLYILLALSSACIALARDFAVMTFGILTMTLGIGAFLAIFPAMSYAFIEKDKQAVSIASLGLMYAPLSFTVAPLIGYFRGSLGSYDGLYYLLAVINSACSLIVLLLPKLANRREKAKLKKSQNAVGMEIR